MLASKSQAQMRVHRATVLASLAIAMLTCQQAASADPGEGDPARSAFARTASFTIPAVTLTFSAPLVQVPAGKRYVIELVTLSCSMPLQGASGISAVLNVGQRVAGGSVSTQAFPIFVQAVDGPEDREHFAGTLAARMYADDTTGGPSDVSLTVTRASNIFAVSAWTCTFAISGYLVSLHNEGGD
jgi:hypothetical protein